jgi:hypothetical protein
MSHALYHAESSATRYGGTPDDYLALHAFMDAPQLHVRMPSVRGRAVFHHAWGIDLCAHLFRCRAAGSLLLGSALPSSDPDDLARAVAEDHVREDLREIPSLADWLAALDVPAGPSGLRLIPTSEQANNSARRHGGEPASYLPIHELLDSPLAHDGNHDARATVLLHNTFGIALCEMVFGHYLVVGEGDGMRRVPTRYIARDHVERECGRVVSTLDTCLDSLKTLPWMGGRAQALSRRAGAGHLGSSM